MKVNETLPMPKRPPEGATPMSRADAARYCAAWNEHTGVWNLAEGRLGERLGLPLGPRWEDAEGGVKCDWPNVGAPMRVHMRARLKGDELFACIVFGEAQEKWAPDRRNSMRLAKLDPSKIESAFWAADEVARDKAEREEYAREQMAINIARQEEKFAQRFSKAATARRRPSPASKAVR